MKYWNLTGAGRERLEVAEGDAPVAGYGEVLVKVASVSLNYRDMLVIGGQIGVGRPDRFTPASDMCGAVVACGPGVTRFAVGDRVLSTYVPGWIDGRTPGTASRPGVQTMGGPRQGVLAEYVALPAEWLVAAPASLDDAQASTLPIAGVTAWYSLIEKGGLRAGQTVVAQGTGGVALFGVQIAKAHGARVIVTSSDDAKLERAKALGADIGINRLKTDWAQAVLAATDGVGADHILEIAAGPGLTKSVHAAALHAQIAVIGVIEGLELTAPVVEVLTKQVTIRGIWVAHRRAAEDFVRAVDTLGLEPVIDAEYAFEDLQQALDHLERGPFGKVVVRVGA